jgi:hypothetical protein
VQGMRSATACHCIPSWPTCYRFGGVSNALLKKKLTNKKKNLSLAKSYSSWEEAEQQEDGGMMKYG